MNDKVLVEISLFKKLLFLFIAIINFIICSATLWDCFLFLNDENIRKFFFYI